MGGVLDSSPECFLKSLVFLKKTSTKPNQCNQCNEESSITGKILPSIGPNIAMRVFCLVLVRLLTSYLAIL